MTQTRPTPTLPTAEHADLLGALATHRQFLRHTVIGLTEEQIRQRPTASELCLGGLLKHVASGEAGWLRFVVEGTDALSFSRDEDFEQHAAQFRVEPDDTLEGLLASYEEVAVATERTIAAIGDLGLSHPLPEAPWFEPDASWSVRRVLIHMIAETAQHAGHADIIRETIDGQRTMG